MDMIAHQTVGVQLATRAHEDAPQLEKIERAIFISSETGGAIIGALDRMNSDPWKHDACAPWHATSTDNLPVALTNENVVCP